MNNLIQLKDSRENVSIGPEINLLKQNVRALNERVEKIQQKNDIMDEEFEDMMTDMDQIEKTVLTVMVNLSSYSFNLTHYP